MAGSRARYGPRDLVDQWGVCAPTATDIEVILPRDVVVGCSQVEPGCAKGGSRVVRGWVKVMNKTLNRSGQRQEYT